MEKIWLRPTGWYRSLAGWAPWPKRLASSICPERPRDTAYGVSSRTGRGAAAGLRHVRVRTRRGGPKPRGWGCELSGTLSTLGTHRGRATGCPCICATHGHAAAARNKKPCLCKVPSDPLLTNSINGEMLKGPSSNIRASGLRAERESDVTGTLSVQGSS